MAMNQRETLNKNNSQLLEEKLKQEQQRKEEAKLKLSLSPELIG